VASGSQAEQLRGDLVEGTDISQLGDGFSEFSRIGTGTRSSVYRARELATGRFVALKVLDLREVSASALDSFTRQAAVLGALGTHPNIVTLYRSLRLPDGRPVLVLELCVGSVADRLSGGRSIAPPEAVSLGIKIAGALETAHHGGVLHRDVRPQNILVTEFGEPALSDFGIATLHYPHASAGLYEFAGPHAAPELLEGGAPSEATDVYGLASTLYELLAGRSAFRAYEAEPAASVILRILRDRAAPISDGTIPLALSDLLLWGLAKDPGGRPPSMAWFTTELAHIESSEGWQRTPKLVAEPRPVTAARRPRLSLRRWDQRRPQLLRGGRG
jgi:serine/threonine protein kinase